MSQDQADKKSFQRRRRRRRMGERGAGERKKKGEAVSQTICLGGLRREGEERFREGQGGREREKRRGPKDQTKKEEQAEQYAASWAP